MSRQRAIVLAAGEGKRMRSACPKVLHQISGRSMVWYVIHELRKAGIDDIALVLNPKLAERPELTELEPYTPVIQQQPYGTGDAVRTALATLDPDDEATIMVVNADMPLLDATLFGELLAALDGKATMAMAVAKMGVSSSFGRVERDAAGFVCRIIETRDANTTERALDEMNVGLYAFREKALRSVVPLLKADNLQGEYYLTDALALFRAQNHVVTAIMVPERARVLGVNDRVELAEAQMVMQRRLCEQHMRAGVTIIDPATTYLEPSLKIGSDVVLQPNTTIGGHSSIDEAAIIGPNTRLYHAHIGPRTEIRESVIIDSRVAADCQIGPFSHVRMGTEIAADVRIGNFVELKNTQLAQGVRAGHLSYLGDAHVGAATNIGAGTVTCNYDGKHKHRTVIGARAFIGSNSSLIAPLQIGDDALTGAGSVVRQNVEAGARVVGNPARSIAART